MREPPADLPDDTLRACLRDRYQLAVAELTFLPLGYDSSAWVYRARTTDGETYFVKARMGAVNEPGLLIPRYLRDQGIAHVVAPLPTEEGRLWTTTGQGGYAVILYPFVAGTSGMQSGLTERQWIDYGALLRQVHATALAPDLARIMRRETFTPAGADAVGRLDAHIGARDFDDPVAHALATFWQARREEIRTLIQHANDLGRRLAQLAPPFVLCHADVHTDNVLLDEDGQVWIVDWDETMLAPLERDLMFVLGGGISRELVGPREEELFLRGYGPVTSDPDPLALAYYRYAWAVSDVGAYGEEVFFRPDLGPVSRRAAFDTFMSLFRPGEIVALAFASDAGPID